MRLSLKLRPRAEGVDDHGRSGPSNEAASSIVSTGLMTRKTHTVGRVTLISPLPFLFPCASGSNVGNEARQKVTQFEERRMSDDRLRSFGAP